MKQFLSRYSYRMFKLFITQIAIGIFGLVLTAFSATVNNTVLSVVIGCGTIIFYLFLLYVTMWEEGAHDKPAIDGGRLKYNPLTGLYIALGAGIPTYLLTLIYGALLPMANVEGPASTVCAFSILILNLLNGAYVDIMSVIKIGDHILNSFWWIHLVATLPALIVSTVAYITGRKELHFTKIMIPLTPEELEQKREKKRSHENKD